MLNSGKNLWFFVPHEIEIWWMTLKNNSAPLQYCIKLCAAFQSHWHIQTEVTVWKPSIRVKIGVKLCASFQIHWGSQTWVTAWKWSSRVKIGDFFCPTWPWKLSYDLENNRAPLLCCFNLCASFHSQWWIQTGVTARKRPICFKNTNFFSHVTLKFDGWPWRSIGYLF